MNRLPKRLTIALLIGGVALALSRLPLREAFDALRTADMFVETDNDNFNPGPAVGSHFPGVRARYQDRALNLVAEFAGKHGMVFIAVRSLDWCPYCVRQMIQLQQHRADFQAAGIGMVAMSYDEPGIQQAFIDKFGITIPILSDINALSFKTLGILNIEYEPGDPRYGIPYPGTIVISPGGTVVGKLFLKPYHQRVDAAAVLAYAKDSLTKY